MEINVSDNVEEKFIDLSDYEMINNREVYLKGEISVETALEVIINLRYLGHHAIPIKEQGHFDVSLDVYANIICLCPICHRLLHYGVNEDKQKILSKVYHDRAERLAKSGIKLSKEEFTKVAI